jgi:hypothetical protein
VDDGRCARLEEALGAAQHQVATLQGLVDARHLELEVLREQTTELQGAGDLEATLGNTKYNNNNYIIFKSSGEK